MKIEAGRKLNTQKPESRPGDARRGDRQEDHCPAGQRGSRDWPRSPRLPARPSMLSRRFMALVIPTIQIRTTRKDATGWKRNRQARIERDRGDEDLSNQLVRRPKVPDVIGEAEQRDGGEPPRPTPRGEGPGEGRSSRETPPASRLRSPGRRAAQWVCGASGPRSAQPRDRDAAQAAEEQRQNEDKREAEGEAPCQTPGLRRPHGHARQRGR